jgi:hypothetical protein
MNGRKTITGLALLALALALVPSALAAGSSGVRPDDRAGSLGLGGTPAAAVPTYGHVRPDDRGDVRGPSDAPVSIQPSPAPVVVYNNPGGFDWSSASIGAAAGAALILLALGAGTLLRHRRSELRPT